MLRITHLEEIAGLLHQLPNLVQQQERRSIDFVPNTSAWLNSLEKVFVASRIYQAGDIAMLRSSLIATDHGQLPDSIIFRGRPTRSRVMIAVASRALQRASEMVSSLIAENQSRFAEAERISQQIVATARSRGLIADRTKEINNTQYLRMIRSNLVTNEDLGNAIVHLEGLVGPYDSLIFIDRALTPYLDSHTVSMQLVVSPSTK